MAGKIEKERLQIYKEIRERAGRGEMVVDLAKEYQISKGSYYSWASRQNDFESRVITIEDKPTSKEKLLLGFIKTQLSTLNELVRELERNLE